MQELNTAVVTPEIIENAYSYTEYRTMIDTLLSENKTTGTNHDESYLEYTRMNVRRMSRWDKTAKISPELEQLVLQAKEPQVWLIITEAWCGDAAQSMPFIAKLAELNPLISCKIVLRDEHPDLMDNYLTEGAKSIPILVAFNQDLSQELFVWGPRPAYLQERLREFKKNPDSMTQQEFVDGVHLWYARDKNKMIGEELAHLISKTI